MRNGETVIGKHGMQEACCGFLAVAIAALLAVVSSNACGVERPNPSAEERVRDAELVVAVDGVEMLPKTSREFDRFYRVSVRIASFLK